MAPFKYVSLSSDAQNLKPICHFPCREVSYVKDWVLGDATPCRPLNMLPTFQGNIIPPSARFSHRERRKIFTSREGVTFQQDLNPRQHCSENIRYSAAIFSSRTDGHIAIIFGDQTLKMVATWCWETVLNMYQQPSWCHKTEGNSNITCRFKVSYLLFGLSTEKFLHLIDLAAVRRESLASLYIEFLELHFRVVYRGVEEFPFLFLQIRNKSRA